MTYPELGVGGFALGSGMGLLSRQYGLPVDNLRSLDVITADAEVLHASEANHPERSWALRAGSGNVRVVSSFEFDCYEVDAEVLIGIVLDPTEPAGEAFEFYREVTVELLEELLVGSVIAWFGAAPISPRRCTAKVSSDSGERIRPESRTASAASNRSESVESRRSISSGERMA